MSRIGRIVRLPPAEIVRKAGARLVDLVGPQALCSRWSSGFGRGAARLNPGPYLERPESGPTNLEHKLARQAAGGPFEPVEIVLVNNAVLELAGPAATVAEFGSGTGYFAHRYATKNPRSSVKASEFHEPTRTWAAAQRAAPNLDYGRFPTGDFATGAVELAVAIEVIEHVADYAGLLGELARVSTRAIVTTPNRERSWRDRDVLTPRYGDHVREWSASEFLWVLRCFWDDVQMHGIKNFPRSLAALRNDAEFQPAAERLGHWSRSPQLIAVCRKPRRPS